MSADLDLDPDSGFTESTLDGLRRDVTKARSSSGIAAEVENSHRLRNAQRQRLFWVVLGLVAVGFLALVALIGLLGIGWIALESPVAVAAIAAVGVQPFVLIGILTRSVYTDVESGPSTRE